MDVNELELKSGLTKKAWLALIMAVCLFVPLNIYTFLTLGIVSGAVALYFITIVFSEVCILLGKSLNKQETFMIYSAAQWGGAGMPVFWLIVYRAYFVNSPFAWSYKINGVPLAKLVPSWLSPPYNSPALLNRTLFQPEFFVPLTITFIQMILGLLANIFLGIIAAKIYVERIRLPFPLATVDYSITSFLSERHSNVAKYFLGALMVGIAWGAAAYLPVSIGVPVIPIPFIDFTWLLQEVLPGGIMAFVTTLSTYIYGFMLPIEATTCMLIPSIIIWVFLNSFFVTIWPDIFPQWASEYTKGMGLISIQNRSSLRVWFPLQIGFALAASIFITFKGRKMIYRVFKEAISRKEEKSELPRMSIAVLGWLVTTSMSIIIFHIFIPEIPIWIPIFYGIGLSFFVSIILSSSVGEVGIAPAAVISSLNQAWYPLVYSTPYEGYAGFSFTPPLTGVRSGVFSRSVKAAYMVGAKPIDLIKIWIIGGVLAQIIGLVMLDFMWRIAPIPSSAYPYSIFAVISQTYTDAIVATRQLNFSLETLLIPIFIVLPIMFVGDLLASRKGVFFSALGFLMGLYATPYNALAFFIGSAVGRFIMPRFFGGREGWYRSRGYLVAGYLSGEGLIMMLATCITMIYKASWLWPW